MLLDPQKLPCLENYTIKVAIVRFKTVGYGIRSIYSKTLLSNRCSENDGKNNTKS